MTALRGPQQWVKLYIFEKDIKMKLTAEQILQQIRDRGVDYYNVYNEENEDNENNYSEHENGFRSLPIGIAADAAQEPIIEGASPRGQKEEEEALASSETLPLDSDQVERFIVQLFDNGPDAFQRYKLKIRLNLTDKTNPEFIASLTKDIRNFKKYIPEPYRDEIIQMAVEERQRIKKQYGVYPYLGKFHLNTGRSSQRKNTGNQVEPDTFAVVWWDDDVKGWSGIFKIQNFAREFDLFTEYLTPAQRAQGVKAQDNWCNPKYDQRIRPKTWAEQRWGSK